MRLFFRRQAPPKDGVHAQSDLALDASSGPLTALPRSGPRKFASQLYREQRMNVDKGFSTVKTEMVLWTEGRAKCSCWNARRLGSKIFGRVIESRGRRMAGFYATRSEGYRLVHVG